MNLPRSHQLLVFSDLDATLLDHHSYSFEAAKPALKKLAELNIPLILNSSKTYAEIQKIRHALNNTYPFIIENGAAIVIPKNTFEKSYEEFIRFSIDHQLILKTLDDLKKQGFAFQSFTDLSAHALAKLTNLSTEDAALAKQRFATEPINWLGAENELLQFKQALSKLDLNLIRGGRFYHVMGFFDKGFAIEKLLKLYQQHHPKYFFTSIALGDSLNDEAMLNKADIPVVIKSRQSKNIHLNNKNALYTAEQGPEGWNKAILSILDSAKIT